MKIQLYSATYNTKVYRIHKIFGFLLEYNSFEKVDIKLPNKIRVLYEQLANPYLLSPVVELKERYKYHKKLIYTEFIARLFTFLCLRSFLFVRLLSNFRIPIFMSTEEAILFYRRLYPGQQKKLCLPRSLFAACTSKSFKNEGALFIGVFLPSRAMHAWILEEGKQPDPYDDIWICYQPVSVMYNFRL